MEKKGPPMVPDRRVDAQMDGACLVERKDRCDQPVWTKESAEPWAPCRGRGCRSTKTEVRCS